MFQFSPLEWLRSDKGAALGGLACAIAWALKTFLPPHTVAHQIAEQVLNGGIAVGVWNVAGRAAKE